ncbi:MAG: polyphosphate kinase 1 [Planctomycetota bacterium]
MGPNLISKEISWLSFNHRVLMEAQSPDVPLIERLRFLGIYSSNLDEFFRVRVATLRRQVQAPASRRRKGEDPSAVLKAVETQVAHIHREFERIWKDLIGLLAQHGINFIQPKDLKGEEEVFIQQFFRDKVRPKLIPLMLGGKTPPSLEDGPLHLLVRMRHPAGRVMLSLIEVPTDALPRFVELPSHTSGVNRLILLEDVIRWGLPELFSLFSCNGHESYAIKLTRDAELELEGAKNRSLVEGVSEGLRLRRLGTPVHIIHDANMPSDLLDEFLKIMKLPVDIMRFAGGRVHNRRDFMRFPDFGRTKLVYPPLAKLPSPSLDSSPSNLDAIARKDILLSFPYQGFSHIIDLLREAAMDPGVTSIFMCLYRVARDSAVVNALVNAARNGKKVTVIMEIQARFDEEANLLWGRWLEEEGVRVIYGIAGFKVHAKLLLITRNEKEGPVDYAALGTGNFNEDTAGIYSDHSLLTSRVSITRDVRRVFKFLVMKSSKIVLGQLLVSPFNTRSTVLKLIAQEVQKARRGRNAEIFMKLNNMADEQIIRALYEASESGVRVRLIVRSMFSFPDVWRPSPRFEAISLVDRFLEHARIFMFGAGSEARIYISSADMMERNLDRRVEVSCPILDPDIKKRLQDIMELQWADSAKTWAWTNTLKGEPRHLQGVGVVRAQMAIVDYLRHTLSTEV